MSIKGNLVFLKWFYKPLILGLMAPAVARKSQKPYRNHVEDPMGETYSPAVRKSNKSRGYSIISPPYGGNRA